MIKLNIKDRSITRIVNTTGDTTLCIAKIRDRNKKLINKVFLFYKGRINSTLINSKFIVHEHFFIGYL